jgi:ABC-type multidrug transport system fused ATPase/permease subunit
MTSTAIKLWALLTADERRRALLLVLLMFAVGLAEVTGLMSIVPLVAALTSSTDPCLRLGAAAGAACSKLLPTRDPYVLGGFAFALIALSNLLAFLVVWLSARLTWSVWRRLSAHVFAAYLQKPYEFFFDTHSSGVVKNVVFETERFAHLVFMPASILASRIIVAAAVVLVVLVVDPVVSVGILVVFTAAYWGVYRQLQARVKKSGDLAFESRDRIARITTETVAGIRELRMLGTEKHFSDSFRRAARTLAQQYVYGNVVSVTPRYVIETAALAFMLLAAVYLSRSLGGWETAAPLVAFYIFAAYRLLPQFQQIYANAMLVQQNARVVEAFAELMAEPAAAVAREPRPAVVAPAPPIVLENVTYRYAGTDNPVLERASMTIPARASVGMAGATGTGKSTVIDLIAGLLTPSSGAIVLNGVALTPELAPAWRARIGYVPQVLFLLDDSIRRNIAFGLPDDEISQAQVERAARLANIHDFIARLPQGYDTTVGERGVRLSGGQRQRLVIARALYRDPEVLIFDEATSALDQETEQAVMEAIRTLTHQKTLLIISHRPATLQGCDLVYEVADGKITARQPTPLWNSSAPPAARR